MKLTKQQLKQEVRKVVKEQLDEQWFSGSSKNEAMDLMDQLKELMGADTLLDELARAMSSDDLLDNLQHIAQMHDLPIEYENEG